MNLEDFKITLYENDIREDVIVFIVYSDNGIVEEHKELLKYEVTPDVFTWVHNWYHGQNYNIIGYTLLNEVNMYNELKVGV